MNKQVAGLALGARSGVRKNITFRKQTEKTKIKECHNGTKIGASNIFGGNQLIFGIAAQYLFKQFRYGYIF